jgi:putative phosphoesterase
VRGNVDTAPWASAVPMTEVVAVGGRHLYVLHQLGQLDLDPGAAGFSAVIYGHSHKPSAETRRGVLYLNPGSAGPRRFDLPVTLVRLRVSSDVLEPEFVSLESPRVP